MQIERDAFYAMLGIAMRAGQLSLGESSVLKAISSGQRHRQAGTHERRDCAGLAGRQAAGFGQGGGDGRRAVSGKITTRQ